MLLDIESTLALAMNDAVREGIKGKLTANYDNPLHKVVVAAINDNAEGLRLLIGDAVKALAADPEFRAAVAAEVRTKLAKQLVQRFGGEMERQVNTLKSDPATRARITLAIEEIAAGRGS